MKLHRPKPMHWIVNLICGLGLSLLSASALSQGIAKEDIGAMLAPHPTLAAGQSATQLPDGNWLLLGGRGNGNDSSPNAVLVNATSGGSSALDGKLATPRTGHSATLLPDGQVLILGGTSTSGAVLDTAEKFDPSTLRFTSVGSVGLLGRSGHTATVLTDGRLLVVGGVDSKGFAVQDVELYDPASGRVERLNAQLNASRIQHVAALLPDRNVLLWGGVTPQGHALQTGDLFDAAAQRFTGVAPNAARGLANMLSNAGVPTVVDSAPVSAATQVPVTQRLMVRFNKRMSVASLNATTVTLMGPTGMVKVKPVAVEGGVVLFVTPEQELLPDSSFTLFIQGATDEYGQPLPLVAIGFKTQTLGGAASSTSGSATATVVATPSGAGSATTKPAPVVASAVAAGTGADDEETWTPGERNFHGDWTSGRRRLSARSIPNHKMVKWALHGDPQFLKLKPADVAARRLPQAPRGPEGVTAIAGQVLRLNGLPLAGVTLSVGNRRERSDANGEFLITNVASGHQVLVIDGETASQGERRYGRYEYGMEVKAGETNVLPFVSWMTRLDSQNKIKLPSPTTATTVLTNPAIPGLELRIPPGTVIRDSQGKIVTEISMTAIPVDQPPFPLPSFPVPVYFTVQPGGAHLVGIDAKSAKGAQLIYPNFSHAPAGTRIAFWDYDSAARGWFEYGHGTVTADQKKVMPDPGVVIYEFSGAMVSVPGNAPPSGPPAGAPPGGGGDGSGDGAPGDGAPADGAPGDDAPGDGAPGDGAPGDGGPGDGNGGSGGGDGGGSCPATSSAGDPAEVYAGLLDRVPDSSTASSMANNGYRPSVDMSMASGNREFDHASNSAPSASAGDPVDLFTGLFMHDATDIAIPDVIPIAINRSYRSADEASRAFGIGTSMSYDMFIVGSTFPYTYQYLVTANGGHVYFPRISPGLYYGDAVYQATAGAAGTPYYGAILKWDTSFYGATWSLTLKNGTVYYFAESYAAVNPRLAAAVGFRDRYGNTVTLTRSGGNLTQISSPNGRHLNLTYDSFNRVSQVTDDIGRTVTYSYDATGRLQSVTDPMGKTAQFTYATQSVNPATSIGGVSSTTNMMTVVDKLGQTMVTNVYDTNGRVVKQTYADGRTLTLAYTLSTTTNTPTTVITGAGGTAGWVSNGAGGYTLSYVSQVDVTNERGVVSRTAFDSNGFKTNKIVALGLPEQLTAAYARDATTFLLNSVVDPLGRTTTYQYDALGNVTMSTALSGTPNAVSTSSTYDPTYSRRTSFTDANGNQTTYTYDAFGNLTAVTNALNRKATSTYDSSGRRVSVSDPLGNTTTYTYVGADLSSVTDPLGRTSSVFTDGVGRIKSTTDPLGNASYMSYDPLNRLLSTTDPRGGTISRTYDANGNVLTRTDQNLNGASFTYDARNRLTGMVDALTRQTTRTYEPGGNINRVTDRNGQVSGVAAFDGLGRTVQAGYGATVAAPTAYKSTVTNTWDAGSRLTKIVDSVSGTMTRTYDGLDRLLSETTPQGSVGYTYDAGGRRSTMTVQGLPTVTYTWDVTNRLTQIQQAAGAVNGNVAQTVKFAYDNANRRTQTTLANGIVATYGYDNANELTSITYVTSTGTTIGDLTYTYDAAGRRTSVGGSLANVQPGVPVSTTSFDANNRLTNWSGQALTYDNNGNLTSDGSNTYVWNERNQLVSISGAVSATFQYDSLGRRTAKTVAGTTTTFVYDGPNAAQVQSGGSTVSLLSGLGIDELYASLSASQQSHMITDALGSTIALTDGTQAVKGSYSYDAYGNTTPLGTASTSWQYTGRENDGTGLYFYRARYYNPKLGRFISEDPIGWASGQTNGYAYVGGNPVSYNDPWGLQSPMGCANPANAAACAEAGMLTRPMPPIVPPMTTPASSLPPGYWGGDRGAEEWGRRNGVSPADARGRFHGVKQGDKGRGKDVYGVDPSTGSVCNPAGEDVGNLGDSPRK